MKTLTYESPWTGEKHELTLHVGGYASDPMVMGIHMTDSDGAPYGNATVNLGNDIGNGSFMQYGCSFTDENNMAGIGWAFEDAGLAESYTRFGEPVVAQSGYCDYPLYKFDMDKLAEYDPKGVEEYKAGYEKAVKVEQRRRNAEMMGSFGMESDGIDCDFE